MEFFTDGDPLGGECCFGGVIYSTMRRTVSSMLCAAMVRLSKQEAAFLSFLVTHMGTLVTAHALSWACTLPHVGRKRPDRHHLRMIARNVRNKIEEIAPGSSMHILTAFDGGGYMVVDSERDVRRLRRSGIYLAREDFKRQGSR